MTIKHKSQKYYSTSIFHFTLMGFSQYKVVVNPHFYAVVCFSLPFISFSYTCLDSTLVLHMFSTYRSIFSFPYPHAIWFYTVYSWKSTSFLTSLGISPTSRILYMKLSRTQIIISDWSEKCKIVRSWRRKCSCGQDFDIWYLVVTS